MDCDGSPAAHVARVAPFEARPVRTRAGGPVVVRRVATSNGEEINGVQVAADPRGGWVLAERQFRRSKDSDYYVRAMTLTPAC